MLTQRLIPSLLLRGGRLVKGARFKDHKDAGLPHTTARAHNAQGADELIISDIDASRENRPPDLNAIGRVAAECFMPLTVGGGIRNQDIARECMAHGADKLCLTSTALADPDLISRLANRFGSQAIVLGVDVAVMSGGWSLYDYLTGGAGNGDVLAWLKEGVRRGAGEIRLMAVDREGTRNGMDTDLLQACRKAVGVPIVLEGGAGDLDHLDAAFEAGADGVAVGNMLVFSDNNLVKIKRFLTGRERRVRP